MADHPLRSATHLRLGGLLPRQLANGTRTHPQVAGPKVPTFNSTTKVTEYYAVLIPVSRGYPPLEGRLSTRYSPVRRLIDPERPTPLDLHVLGTPPAFVLSQDQTLMCNQKLTGMLRTHFSFIKEHF